MKQIKHLSALHLILSQDIPSRTSTVIMAFSHPILQPSRISYSDSSTSGIMNESSLEGEEADIVLRRCLSPNAVIATPSTFS